MALKKLFKVIARDEHEFEAHSNLKFLQYNEGNKRNLWDQLFGHIAESVGKGKNFQLTYPFIDWTWDIPPPHYINTKAYTYLNQIPKWSATGNYDPAASGLYDSYRAMLIRCPILTITAEQRQQMKEIQDDINRAEAKYTTDNQAMNYNWVQAQKVPKGVPPPEYDDWQKKSGWKKIIESDSNRVDELADRQTEITAQQNAGYKQAMDKSKMPTGTDDSKAGFLKVQVSGNDEWRAGYIVNNGQDWKAQLTEGGGNSLEISLDASKTTHYIQESWAQGAADFSQDFFGIYINGSWQSLDLSDSDSSLKVTISIQAVTQVPVSPGVWYDGGYLKTLAMENRWNSPYTTQGGEHAVFGKGGLLPLMITGLVAGYQPSLKISMHSSTFNRYQSMFEGAGGFRVGPFHFGGTYHQRTDNWTRNAENNCFEAKSTVNYPFIMGFTVASPGLS